MLENGAWITIYTTASMLVSPASVNACVEVECGGSFSVYLSVTVRNRSSAISPYKNQRKECLRNNVSLILASLCTHKTDSYMFIVVCS